MMITVYMILQVRVRPYDRALFNFTELLSLLTVFAVQLSTVLRNSPTMLSNVLDYPVYILLIVVVSFFLYGMVSRGPAAPATACRAQPQPSLLRCPPSGCHASSLLVLWQTSSFIPWAWQKVLGQRLKKGRYSRLKRCSNWCGRHCRYLAVHEWKWSAPPREGSEAMKSSHSASANRVEPAFPRESLPRKPSPHLLMNPQTAMGPQQGRLTLKDLRNIQLRLRVPTNSASRHEAAPEGSK